MPTTWEPSISKAKGELKGDRSFGDFKNQFMSDINYWFLRIQKLRYCECFWRWRKDKGVEIALQLFKYAEVFKTIYYSSGKKDALVCLHASSHFYNTAKGHMIKHLSENKFFNIQQMYYLQQAMDDYLMMKINWKPPGWNGNLHLTKKSKHPFLFFLVLRKMLSIMLIVSMASYGEIHRTYRSLIVFQQSDLRQDTLDKRLRIKKILWQKTKTSKYRKLLVHPILLAKPFEN